VLFDNRFLSIQGSAGVGRFLGLKEAMKPFFGYGDDIYE